MLVHEDACARCGRLTPTDDLRLWTTRERLREFRRSAPVSAPKVAVLASPTSPPSAWGESPLSPAPPAPRGPAVTYRWITSAHALCIDCHGVVEAAPSRFHDHDRRRAWVVLIAVVGLFALAWAGFAPFTHNWIAAFWQNGAGGAMSGGSAVRRLGFALCALALAGGGCARAQSQPAGPPTEEAPVYSAQVVNAYPHDRSAFTEGLFFKDGALYESTGYEGRSSIRKVELATGKVLQKRDLDSAYFGEGITAFGDRLIELTWKSQVGFVYDLASFAPKDRFTYAGEGWALTTDGRRIIMSDGTNTLRFLDPKTLKQTGSVAVTYGGKKVIYLNELEWVKGEVWANIWTTDQIVRIDPDTGKVKGWIDLSGLLPARERNGSEDVLNGIAYDAATDRIFVTGKQWPKLYEIKLIPPSPR